MGLKNIVAIVREDAMETLLEALRQAKVPGITITETKGLGQYVNTYDYGALNVCYKFEIMVLESQVNDLITLITETVSTGISGDGIVAVTPVESIMRIWDKKEIRDSWEK